jgi:hypothetical protein
MEHFLLVYVFETNMSFHGIFLLGVGVLVTEPMYLHKKISFKNMYTGTGTDIYLYFPTLSS